MIITPDQVREKVSDLWPDLEYVWLWDKEFWKSPLATIEEALKNSNVPNTQFVDGFWDCDDYALQFMAEVRRKRYFQWVNGKLPEDSRYPIAIGFAFGNMFRGISKVHAVNLCLCQEGVYLLDATPGERRIWEASSKQDNLIYLSM